MKKESSDKTLKRRSINGNNYRIDPKGEGYTVKIWNDKNRVSNGRYDFFESLDAANDFVKDEIKKEEDK